MYHLIDTTMKKLFTTLFIGINILGGVAIAQTNTLPQNGDVGIGTLNPSAKLDVNGHVRIDSTLLIKDSILIQKDARIIEDLKVEGQVYFPNIEFANGLTNTDLLVKDQNGQVLKTPVLNLGELIYSIPCFTDASGNVSHPVWGNGLNKIYNDCPPVYVGVGTDSPRVKLDVIGTVSVNRITIGVPDPENSLPKFHMKMVGSPSNVSTIFLIENTQRTLFQINNDGIVRTREVMVNLDNAWPDYVFDKTYKLQPLEEIERYIEKNGHLPNVPTAKSIREEGLALGEMNKVLLEKVEELTLYLIEQNKRIELLEEQIEKSNKK